MATIKGGDKFAAALAKISKGVSQPAVLRVGFLESAKYPDGKPVGIRNPKAEKKKTQFFHLGFTGRFYNRCPGKESLMII